MEKTYQVICCARILDRQTLNVFSRLPAGQSLLLEDAQFLYGLGVFRKERENGDSGRFQECGHGKYDLLQE